MPASALQHIKDERVCLSYTLISWHIPCVHSGLAGGLLVEPLSTCADVLRMSPRNRKMGCSVDLMDDG